MNFSSFQQWWRRQTGKLKLDVISPIDLIPDFIPILGYLDDLILIPIGILITRKMIPDYVWTECSGIARTAPVPRSLYYFGISLVIVGWVGIAYILIRWLF